MNDYEIKINIEGVIDKQEIKRLLEFILEHPHIDNWDYRIKNND